MKIIHYFFLALLVFSGLLVGCGSGNPGGRSLAVIKEVQGKVMIKSPAGSSWVSAQINTNLQVGDFLKTGDDGQTTLELSNGDRLVFQSDSFFELKDGEAFGHQTGGRIKYSIGKKGKEIQVTTPHAQTTILGTEFTIQVVNDESRIALFQGSVKIKSVSSGEEKLIDPGKMAVVSVKTFGLIDFPLSSPDPTKVFRVPVPSDGKENPGGNIPPPASPSALPSESKTQ